VTTRITASAEQPTRHACHVNHTLTTQCSTLSEQQLKSNYLNYMHNNLSTRITAGAARITRHVGHVNHTLTIQNTTLK